MTDYYGIPMKQKHLDLIYDLKKTTTLRSLKYDKYHFEKRIINVPDDLTDEIVESEGYETKEELIKELKRLRHRLPKKMFLYFLNKPIY